MEEDAVTSLEMSYSIFQAPDKTGDIEAGIMKVLYGLMQYHNSLSIFLENLALYGYIQVC